MVFSTLFKYFFSNQSNDQGSTNDASQEEVENLQAGSNQELQQEQQQRQEQQQQLQHEHQLLQQQQLLQQKQLQQEQKRQLKQQQQQLKQELEQLQQELLQQQEQQQQQQTTAAQSQPLPDVAGSEYTTIPQSTFDLRLEERYDNDDQDADVRQHGFHDSHKHRSTPRTRRRDLQLSMANRNPNQCLDCKGTFASARGLLSSRQSRGLCVGCYNLKGVCKTKVDEDDMRRWLRTGELSVDVWIKKARPCVGIVETYARARGMRRRFHKRGETENHVVSEKDFPSEETLRKLYIDSGYKCAVTGWLCPLTNFRGHQFWSATFDHIIPVSKAPPTINPWHIDNVQVLSYAINQVKGNHTDEEVRGWYEQWLSANR